MGRRSNAIRRRSRRTCRTARSAWKRRANSMPGGAMPEPRDLHDPALRDRAVRAARGQDRFDVLLTGTRRYIGRRDLGLIAPGRRADMIVLSDLTELAVMQAFASGAMVAADGRLLATLPSSPPGAPLETMQLQPLSDADFVLRASGVNSGRVRLRTVAKPRFTEWGEVVAEVRDGAVVLPDDAILMAVIHRHAAPATPVLGVLQGWSWAWRDRRLPQPGGVRPRARRSRRGGERGDRRRRRDGGRDTRRGDATLRFPVCGLLSDAPATDAPLRSGCLICGRRTSIFRHLTGCFRGTNS